MDASLMLRLEMWERAAARVFADIRATTTVDWRWTVTVHEDEADVPARGYRTLFGGADQAYASTVTLRLPDEPSPPVPRRSLPQPEIFLELSTGWDRWLDLRPATLADAVARLAEFLQDAVIDEIPGAWPACPGASEGRPHGHPMAIETAAAPHWVCPLDGAVRIEIGTLQPVR